MRSSLAETGVGDVLDSSKELFGRTSVHYDAGGYFADGDTVD